MEKLNGMINNRAHDIGENMDMREILLSGENKTLKERSEFY